MVDFGSWVDVLKVWEPASKHKGLPFGSYLHSTPPRRHRTLTGPLDSQQESFWHRLQVLSYVEPEQHTYLQEQCGFLSILPLDVRMIIYDMVLGGMVFHITTNESKSRILSLICKRPAHLNDETHQDCFALPPTRPSSAPRHDYPQATGLLPMLVTCRRIYSEAIDTLYSANIFEFWENRVAFKFLKSMLPSSRLPSIRRFRWDMQIPHHPNLSGRSQRDWSDLFSFFANETSGLQHLYLKLKQNYLMETEIRQTRDVDAMGWVQPMVLMAVNASRKRGCKVEIVFNGTIHEPEEIFKAVALANPIESYDTILGLACAEMHRRIRLSLDSFG